MFDQFAGEMGASQWEIKGSIIKGDHEFVLCALLATDKTAGWVSHRTRWKRKQLINFCEDEPRKVRIDWVKWQEDKSQQLYSMGMLMRQMIHFFVWQAFGLGMWM